MNSGNGPGGQQAGAAWHSREGEQSLVVTELGPGTASEDICKFLAAHVHASCIQICMPLAHAIRPPVTSSQAESKAASVRTCALELACQQGRHAINKPGSSIHRPAFQVPPTELHPYTCPFSMNRCSNGDIFGNGTHVLQRNRPGQVLPPLLSMLHACCRLGNFPLGLPSPGSSVR